jgi:hypothetical protein
MKTNESLSGLQFLIGNWKMEVFNTSFLPNPADKLAGKVRFEWFEDQTFLVMRSSVEGSDPKPPDSVAIVNQDDTTKEFQFLYYDARGVSRIYEMSFENNVWKLWRNAPGFQQHFEGKMSEDKKTIRAAWSKSTDGKTWEHDFDLEYRKV